MPRVRSATQPSTSTRPFMTPEGQENYLISLAYSLAEQRLRDGTASSQEVTHFLNRDSITERLKREKLEEENKLLRAKTEALQSSKQSEELYENAIAAMRKYTGHGGDEDEDY